MKISHICPYVGEQMGGSERYVCTLSKDQSRDHDVHIYTTTKYRDRVGTSVCDEVTIHKSYAPVSIWNINPLAFMVPSLIKSKSDIFHIHSHLYFTSNQAVFAKLLKRQKALLHLHGGVGLPPYDVGIFKLAAKQFYDGSLGKFTIQNCDAIASVSKTDLKEITNSFDIGDKPMLYIPNMVDTDVFRPHPDGLPEEKSILYLGDFEPWKGIGSLIRWICAMKNSNNGNVTIRFVGQGSYMEPLLSLQKKFSNSGNGISVEILGPRNHTEIPTILRNSSALILPSYWEGMPTVLLEAMASGVPIISTRVGDVPFLIRNRETGILIDRSQESFESAIDSIVNNTPLVSKIIDAARSLVTREYTLSNINKIVHQAYSEILS